MGQFKTIGQTGKASEFAPLLDVQVVTDNITLTAADNGKTFIVTADAKTITLPATEKGLYFKFINGGANGAVLVTISPNASDAIFGTTNASTNVALSGVDDKDLLNTKATAIKGDTVTLYGDGDTGWFAGDFGGIWASQS